jgi:hypothetical protein
MHPFAIGHQVTLDSGEAGVVIGFNKHDRPCRPRVKILKKGRKSIPPYDVDLDLDKRFIIQYDSSSEDCSRYYYEL